MHFQNPRPAFWATFALALAIALSGCSKEEAEEQQPSAETQPGETVSKNSTEAPRETAAAPAPIRSNFNDEIDIPVQAQQLHQESRQLGKSGDYEAALAKLEEAAAIAPEWPYPHYDMAYTYLLMGQPEQALEKYRAVDSLMPGGFLTTKTAIWTLEREARGMLPQDLYRNYVMLEWTPENERRQKISDLVQRYPNFAPAWKDAATFIEDPAKRILVINQGLSAGPDPETYGLLIINKALAFDQGGEKERAVQMLEALLAEPDITFATRGIAEKALKEIQKPTPANGAAE